MVYDLYRRRRASLNYEHENPDDWSHASFEPAEPATPPYAEPPAADIFSSAPPFESEAGRASSRDAEAQVEATKAKLRSMVEDPDYWKHKKPDAVARVTQAFQAAYGGGPNMDATGKLIRTDPDPDAFAAFEESRNINSPIKAPSKLPVMRKNETLAYNERFRDNAESGGKLASAAWRSGKLPARDLGLREGDHGEYRDLLFRPDQDKVEVREIQNAQQTWPPKGHRQSQDIKEVYKPPAPPMNWQPPLRNIDRITSPFGWRNDPQSGIPKEHKGIDFGVPEGTNIYTAGRGRIIRKGYDPQGYGYYIEILHDDGVMTRYAHLQNFDSPNNPARRWKAGEYLSEQDIALFPLAWSGNSGKSSGPHLHFEARVPSGDPRGQSQALDPIDALWPLFEPWSPRFRGIDTLVVRVDYGLSDKISSYMNETLWNDMPLVNVIRTK